MTGQPERIHHLLDRLLRGVLLPEEREQLAALVRELERRADVSDIVAKGNLQHVKQLIPAVRAAEARVRELEADNARYEEVVVGDLNEANIGLQREVARLTAGQCLDSRAMCEKHHLPPVAGCPYPRCRAASATGRAATA
ncbi:hypothetical protein ACFUIV_18355 [Streptomyces anulatus]|uniref:hypothetical protein n=1 Tax=Streptomyces anulatus TaxID=1892 RepID=UPI00363376C4